MSDENDRTDEGTEDEGQPTGDQPGTNQPDYKADADKWKAMARKHESEAKANRAARDELAKLKEAGKSEAEKLTDRVSQAERERDEARSKATRYEVAADMGIQPKHLKYLTGTTKEEIEESAKGIIDDFPEVYGKSGKDDDKGDKSGTRRPKERMRPGAGPDEEPEETDPRKLAAKIPRR